MRVLIVSTLKRRVDPKITASRSRIIYELVKGLLKRGHKVTLLGTADSFIKGAEVVPVVERGWVDLPPVENPFFREIATLIQIAKKVVELEDKFDIVHNHLYPEFFTPIIENELKTPLLTTVHVQWTDFIDQTLSLFKKTYLISISKAQRRLFKRAKIYKVVYNGIDTELYSFCPKKGDYLLWLGRLSKAKDERGRFLDPKGVRWAIRLAQKMGEKLLLSGNVEDPKFFEREVRPFLNEKIRWIGPVSKEQPLSKEEVVGLMQKAKAFLMTVNWYEPFGLVMAESMSCGTPVVGFAKGAVSEIVRDGVTGFVVEPEKTVGVGPPLLGKNRWQIKKKGIEGLCEAVKRVGEIDPKACREHVVKNFSVEKMVESYEKVYREVLAKEGRLFGGEAK